MECRDRPAVVPDTARAGQFTARILQKQEAEDAIARKYGLPFNLPPDYGMMATTGKIGLARVNLRNTLPKPIPQKEDHAVMNDQLKQRLLVSAIPAGLVFMIYQFTNWEFHLLQVLIALVLGLVISGITYGVMLLMGQ